MTSKKVHEGSYDGWSAKHLRIIFRALSDVIQEMYVFPDLKAEMRQKILALKEEVESEKGSEHQK